MAESDVTGKQPTAEDSAAGGPTAGGPTADGTAADSAAADGVPGSAADGAQGSAANSTRGSAADSTARSGPSGERGSSWRAAGMRSLQEFRNDILQDRAAALTYYSILAIFPGLLVLVSLLGLLGRSDTQPLIANLTAAAPSATRHIILDSVTHLQRSHAAAGLLAVVGILLGVWSASSYVAAFMRAANAIYDVPEGRPAWKKLPIRFGVTLALAVLLVASAVIVVVTGSLARHVGQVLGIGSAAVTAWDIAKWPVLLIMVSMMLALLYWASPNARRGFRLITPGAVGAIVVWLAASGLFALYVANFGNYNKVYGSIAGVIIFLVWMWISNIAILLGAEFNAEVEHGRAIAAGTPPDKVPFVELRDTRKLSRSKPSHTA
jgi:membrane protein